MIRDYCSFSICHNILTAACSDIDITASGCKTKENTYVHSTEARQCPAVSSHKEVCWFHHILYIVLLALKLKFHKFKLISNASRNLPPVLVDNDLYYTLRSEYRRFSNTAATMYCCSLLLLLLLLPRGAEQYRPSAHVQGRVYSAAVCLPIICCARKCSCST